MNLWFDDPGRYIRLIGKLIYLTVTSRFMHQPKEMHWLAAIRVLAYIKSCPGKGLVYRKYEHVRIFGYLDSGYAGD